MTADAALARLAAAHGVFDVYTDMQGVEHVTTPDTARALLEANGVPASSSQEVAEALSDTERCETEGYVAADIVVETAVPKKVPVGGLVTWQVVSEEGEEVLAEGRAEHGLALPALPDGVHRLRLKGAKGVQESCVIVAPRRAPSLADRIGQETTWGVVAALYGLRAEPQRGLGDYGDLGLLAEGLGQYGCGFVGINPVHALGVAAEKVISPYSPVHRGFLNCDHLAVEGLPAMERTPDHIDYAAHRSAHRGALEAAYTTFLQSHERTDEFDAFRTAGGQPLDDFATFEAISEIHGPDCRRWPKDRATKAHAPAERVAYHKWLQWQADRQLGAAQSRATASGMALGLYLDLAVGARVGGAESWGSGSAVATGVTLGAPPDHLSPAGQNWELGALSPRKLAAQRYAPLRFILRQNMRHCGVIRIDHALGLNRSFWLPENGSPGGYIRQPFEALMAIISLEAHRAGTVVVGEDLGLVPEGFRAEMAQRGLYGYSVLQYEKDNNGRFLSPERLRHQSLACFGTHDTPTLAGFWQGRDIAWWEKLGWIKAPDAARAMDKRNAEKRQLAGVLPPEPLPNRVTAGLRDTVHARLAGAPSALVALQLDDILCLEDAQNLPGTIDEHPNWRRRYPETVEAIVASDDLKKTAGIMRDAGRASQMRKDRT